MILFSKLSQPQAEPRAFLNSDKGCKLNWIKTKNLPLNILCIFQLSSQFATHKKLWCTPFIDRRYPVLPSNTHNTKLSRWIFGHNKCSQARNYWELCNSLRKFQNAKIKVVLLTKLWIFANTGFKALVKNAWEPEPRFENTKFFFLLTKDLCKTQVFRLIKITVGAW